jgi:hypothetical protein
MMDEQLAQNQTINALQRQVEASNNSAQQAQALLRANLEQQLQNSRMPPPTTYPSGTGGVIGNNPILPPLTIPSTGMRTRELHDLGIIILAHQRIKVMQSKCVLCMAEMI